MKCLLLLLLSLPSARGVLPTGVLSLDLLPQSAHEPPAFAEQLCAPSAAAGWGVSLPARHDSRWKSLAQLPAGNRDGCASYRLPSDTTTSPHGAVVVVDRGNCSFVVKALKAQAAGAKGLIVRSTKRAVYEAVASHNSTNTSSVLSSTSEQTGAGVAAATHLQVLDKPVFEYDCSRGQAFVDELASPVWQTDAEECSADHRCASRSCVLTGRTEKHESGRKHQVCCMWDTFVLMGATNRTVTKELEIPVVYVTIANGQKLQKAMDKYPTTLVARTYRRELPLIDVSSMLLWAIGVATALGAAYYSTSSLRRRNEEIATREQQKMRGEQDSHHGEDESEGREEIWELDARHAVGFIVLAGVFLTVFYYVKIGGAIPVLFAVSGAATLTQVVAMPAVEWLMPSSSSRDVTIPLLGDTVRLSELLGFLPSCALALVWYMHRRTYWALQDIMGISLCFVFLRTVQLPNLKVATVLLSLAFCYDVFFVFLSPIFFGSSVMEDVATGGPAAYTKSGYPGVDYCERYPHYPACVDPEPMPMLLVLPRVLDWAGGVSMLGLGDIILPGMLLSFSLRFDYSQGNTNYFQLMAVGYAVGLALANIAVMVTEMGQPALMYLVPTTLGTLIAVSKRNGDFRLMWAGVGVDDDDMYSMKRRSSDGPGYRAVGSEEAPTGIVIGDPIGRVIDNSRGGDHVPLLMSVRWSTDCCKASPKLWAMASIHIVGELLGASGLSCPAGQEAFSVAHMIDLLSLHPSSEFSYFCKWRLVVDDPVKSSSNDSSWKVIQGETRGQTQVHASTSGGSLSMPDLYRHSSGKQERILLPKMDTVWAHPIELHLAATNMDMWSCWPRLEFQVWSLDRFQLETLCGRASIPVPLATNEYVLDLPIVLQESSALLGCLARVVGLPFQDNFETSNDSDVMTISSTATLYLRLAVLTRGLDTTEVTN